MKQTFKFASLMLVSLLICALIFGCAAKLGPDMVKDSTETLAVKLPSGWTQNTSGHKGAKLILMGPVHDGFKTNITVITENTGTMSIQEYEKQNIQTLSASSFKVISRSDTIVGGRTSRMITYSIHVADHDIKFNGASVLKDGTAYLLTYTAPSADFDTGVSAFDSVLASVKWLK